MFGYEFVTLDKEQKASRRHLLDLYATIAQWSVPVVLALIQLAVLAHWATRSWAVERPRSPHPRSMSLGARAGTLRVKQKLTQLRWWADKPVRKGWFTKGELTLAGFWTAWLIFLCVHRTGNDYLHLTKRFGIVAASQLPLHYILAMRSAYSPIQLLTRLSYERIIVVHEILGKILTFIFGLHAAFYLNFFIQSGLLSKRLQEWDVITGLIGFVMFATMSTTALSFVRNWNYRVFYTTHVLLAIVIVDVLIFHVSHIRTYVFEMLGAFILLQVFRQIKIRQFAGSIAIIPGTNLIQVTVPLPFDKEAKEFKPGQHVHLSRPPLGQPSFGYSNTMRYRTNPFTIASLPSKDKQLLLIARMLNGNTKRLAEVAKSLRSQSETGTVPQIPLCLEGPYGASSHFPDFREFDQVLLVAGGVGATFTVPIYRSLVEATQAGDAPPVLRTRFRFVWAVRRLAETRWAFPKETNAELDLSEDEQSDRTIEVFVTHSANTEDAGGGDGQGLLDDMELAEGDTLLHEEDDREKARGRTVGYGRPDLGAIVEKTFTGSTGSVAVLVCGPESMITELRGHVQRWVHKDRDVFWHAESFGL